jgi:hypothetical protein
MGKSWPHKQPVITDIYLCGWIYASCLSYISNRPQIGQKLHWNVAQALEKPYTIGILSYTDSWCLVPFSIKYILRQCLRFGYHNQEQSDILVVLCSEVQNEVHSKKILLQSSSTYVGVPATAMLGRVNEASSWNGDQEQLHETFLQKEMSQLLGI